MNYKIKNTINYKKLDNTKEELNEINLKKMT